MQWTSGIPSGVRQLAGPSVFFRLVRTMQPGALVKASGVPKTHKGQLSPLSQTQSILTSPWLRDKMLPTALPLLLGGTRSEQVDLWLNQVPLEQVPTICMGREVGYSYK